MTVPLLNLQNFFSLFIQYFNKLAFLGSQISKSQIIMGQLQIAFGFFGHSPSLPWDAPITS